MRVNKNLFFIIFEETFVFIDFIVIHHRLLMNIIKLIHLILHQNLHLPEVLSILLHLAALPDRVFQYLVCTRPSTRNRATTARHARKSRRGNLAPPGPLIHSISPGEGIFEQGQSLDETGPSISSSLSSIKNEVAVELEQVPRHFPSPGQSSRCSPLRE